MGTYDACRLLKHAHKRMRMFMIPHICDMITVRLIFVWVLFFAICVGTYMMNVYICMSMVVKPWNEPCYGRGYGKYDNDHVQNKNEKFSHVNFDNL